MTPAELERFLMTAADGQAIRVTLASGRNIAGIYNAEDTSEEAGLYFDDMQGNALRADWENVESVDFRNPGAMARSMKMFVPDGHPANRQGPIGVTAQGVPRRAHTSRNG